MMMNTERHVVKALGNLERLEKWQRTRFFLAARKEWFRAWTLLAARHGFATVLNIRAGVQKKSKNAKSAALALLRRSVKPKETLRRQAETIYLAALEGDIEFFRGIGLALRSRPVR